MYSKSWPRKCFEEFASINFSGPSLIKNIFRVTYSRLEFHLWKWSHDLKQPIKMLECQSRVNFNENIFHRIGSRWLDLQPTRRRLRGSVFYDKTSFFAFWSWPCQTFARIWAEKNKAKVSLASKNRFAQLFLALEVVLQTKCKLCTYARLDEAPKLIFKIKPSG